MFKRRLIFTGLMSLGMSGLVGLFITIVNTGIDEDLAMRWLKAWGLAAPIAWFVAFSLAPFAEKITNFLMKKI
ncbi:DUF2798 domain-containing protein [Hirschia maritima]|uniref:DUF2798 domain-containing protein n=1 Tax=Hirschia maritima TaxID=1121961 RepID=UPI00039BF932|nr:DUF2798 domain-containing protein [Hirschia maritima]